MPYVRKEKRVESRVKADETITEFHYKCLDKKYNNVEIPVDSGFVKMFKPTIFNYDVIQAGISATDEQMLGLFGESLNEYKFRWIRDRRPDSFAMYFLKEINASEFLGDKQEALVKVPLTVQIYQGKLKRSDEHFAIDRYAYRDDNPPDAPFVREIILNSEEMKKLNGYMIKKDIDVDAHKKALLMAETAKRELGFDYKKIEGDCIKGVCSCPEEISEHLLPDKLLKETKKDSFKEMVINFKDKGNRHNSGGRLDIEIKPNNLVRMEAENLGYMFKDIFSSLNAEIAADSEISYSEYEHFVVPENLKKAGRVAKKIIPVAIGAGIVYKLGEMAYESAPPASSVLPRLYDAAVLTGLFTATVAGSYLLYRGIKAGFPLLVRGFDYAAEKTKDSPIVHPIRTSRKKRAEEDALLVGHLKSLGIKTNDTRPSSCLFQIDEDACLKIARANLEKKATEKPEGG